MKKVTNSVRGMVGIFGLLIVSGALGQSVVTRQGQASARASGGAGLSVSTVNGQSVVALNGREIYRGPTTGAVSSRSSNVNGIERTAIYDGDKLLWDREGANSRPDARRPKAPPTRTSK